MCFYWGKGTCYKGSACTFLHTKVGESRSTTAFTIVKKREHSYCESTTNLITPYKAPEPGEAFVADILLCKGGGKEDSEAGLAPMYRKKTPSKKESHFPEVYRNGFHRKRNVNLFIQKDVGVVFEFAYDTTIIQAIKTQIKGRTWNPGMKCWTCPLESLPDAVALYEHMGREVDNTLQQRANELTQSLGSASDSIQMSIQLKLPSESTSAETNTGTATTIGSVLVKFLYDADIVASLKQLSPLQRTYDPITKIWTLDVLALPELLDHLQPHGYTPNQQMQDMATCFKKAQELLCSVLEKEEEETQTELETTVKELAGLVHNAKGNATKVDRSGCGQAKRRKLLTISQRKWSRKTISDELNSGEEEGSDCEYGNNDDYFDDIGFDYGSLRCSLQRERTTRPPADCDCGQPWRQMTGRHVCRYFGTFRCDDCGSQWTSAYCWKGEKQACRGCNRESLPFKKEQLDGRPPVRDGGGAHDSTRCAVCRRLGYDCSL